MAALWTGASPVLDAAGIDDLHALRESYRAKYLGLAASALRAYHADLLQLETTAVAGRDYKTAEAIRHERHRVGKMLARGHRSDGDRPAATEGAGGRPDEGIELPIDAATLGGGVTLDAGVLTTWDEPGAYAEWPLPPDLETGGYEIELTYAAGGEDPRGTIVVREPFYKLTRRPVGTGGADRFETHNLGTLRIKADSPAIRLVVEEVVAAPVFALRQVRIIPVAESAGPSRPPR